MDAIRSCRVAAELLIATSFFAMSAVPSAASAAGSDPGTKRLLRGAGPISSGATAPLATTENSTSVQFQFLTFSVQGSPFTAAGGISDAGLVSGFWYDTASNTHGLLWRDGMLQKVDDPAYPQTALGPSNGAGTVVGNAGTSAFQHVVLYDVRRAEWAEVPDFDSNLPQNFGNGINNSGVVVGESCSASVSDCVAWTRDGDQYSPFTVPGSSPAAGGAAANGINDRNQVVGFFSDANSNVHGYLKDGDVFMPFDIGSYGTFASSINDRGDIVGYYLDAQGNLHGFEGKVGKFATIDFPGAVATVVFGINARGDISGWWADSSGVVHAFIGYR